MVIVGHNAKVFDSNWRPTEWTEMVKQRLEGDMWRDTSYWCQAQSNPPLGCLWRLWPSASTLMNAFCPDSNVFAEKIHCELSIAWCQFSRCRCIPKYSSLFVQWFCIWMFGSVLRTSGSSSATLKIKYSRGIALSTQATSKLMTMAAIRLSACWVWPHTVTSIYLNTLCW